MMFGSGPDWSYVPGPYLVGADARSVTPATLAVAEWASTHLVVGSHIAVDIDNGPVHQRHRPPRPGHRDRWARQHRPTLLRPEHRPLRHLADPQGADIRYILIDDGSRESLPLFGTYIEPGELGTSTKPRRLTLAELNKWNSVPGARLIYDNGPIRIYDLASLLQLSPTAPTPGPIDGSRGNRCWTGSCCSWP